MITDSIKLVVSGKDLTEAQMFGTMEEIMSGLATPAQIGSFITALRMKGETIEEITGAAKVMRAKATSIKLEDPGNNDVILDTCGTGGDGANTFNVSTAVAFVAAGGGVIVAKHGNRAVSSKCGSADVLEALGVKLDIGIEKVRECIMQTGIGFLFAPAFHGAMKYAAAPRREIGLRTIFNMLGPLTNPAGATSQVIGVYDPALTEKIARVLENLGTKSAFVVCGEGNVCGEGVFDEISICSPTWISQLKNGEIESFKITPEDFNMERADVEDIRGGDSDQNARIIINIFKGEKGPGRDIVLLNSGAAFVAAGLDHTLSDGINRAAGVIDSGKAREKIDALVAFTNTCR